MRKRGRGDFVSEEGIVDRSSSLTDGLNRNADRLQPSVERIAKTL